MVKTLACSERIVETVMGPPQRGLVHSAFAGAANLLCANDFLLSLNSFSLPDTCSTAQASLEISTGRSSLHLQQNFIDNEQFLPLMPNGLLLSARPRTWPFNALQAGMPVIIGAGWLVIEAISCSLDCGNCPRWNPRIEHPQALDLELVRSNARWLVQFCQSHRPAKGEEKVEHKDDETILALAARICGRGPGLTPSGDDFLAGWMAVGWLFYGPQAHFLAQCQGITEIARQSTHALSQCWLASAAVGDVARPINTFLAALTSPDRARLERSTRHVLALGATSGYDLLQGILYGIEQFPRC